MRKLAIAALVCGSLLFGNPALAQEPKSWLGQIQYSFNTALQGIVGTGSSTEGIVGTGQGTNGIVGTGQSTNGIVGTGKSTKGIVGTGKK